MTKPEVIESILTNPVYAPNSGMRLNLKRALEKMSLVDLGALHLFITLKTGVNATKLLAACKRTIAVLEEYVHGETPEMCAMAETLEDCIAAVGAPPEPTRHPRVFPSQDPTWPKWAVMGGAHNPATQWFNTEAEAEAYANKTGGAS